MAASQFKKTLMLGIVVGIILTLVFFIVRFVNTQSAIMYDDKYIFFHEDDGNLNSLEQQAIERMIRSRTLLTPANIIQEITDFYNLIIQTLVAIIAIISIATFFYIRNNNDELVRGNVKNLMANDVQVNNIIVTATKEYAKEHFKFAEDLETQMSEYGDLGENLNAVMGEQEKIQKKLRRLKNLDKEIQSMSKAIAKLDTSEDANETQKI